MELRDKEEMYFPGRLWAFILDRDFPIRDFEIPVITPESMEQFY